MKRWLIAAAVATAAVFAPARADHQAGTPANVTVNVPVGATLTVDGKRTEQMTAVRKFVTPPLAGGKVHTYSFQAWYTANGKQVSKLQTVEVTAGADVAVHMTAAPDAPVAMPKPTAADADPIPGRFDVPKPVTPKVEGAKPNTPKETDTPKPAEKKQDVKKPEIEVPYVSTPEKVVAEMLKVAAVKEGDVVYDLGCGDGRIVIAAVKNFNAKKGLGIDFNPERIDDSKKAAAKAGSDVEKKLEFKQGDVLKMTEKDFEGVDVVTMYLLPEVNLKLKPVLLKGLKAGARVVSHDFDMGDDWKPEKTVMVMDDEGVSHTVYLWTIKEKK